MPSLAPIGVSAYNRLNHLEKAVAFLKQNPLSEKSEVYFFSDGPAPGDEKKVEEVRKFLRGVKGFKNVHLVERKTNLKIKNNRCGQQELLKKYGRMIWLAEDILCAPGFLTFVNEALDKYKAVPAVQSISGYCPNIAVPPQYTYDGWFTNRFNAWGLGIWAKEYRQAPGIINKSQYNDIIEDKKRKKAFKKYIGEDALEMLHNEVNGRTDALDVRFMWYQFVNNKFTFRPIRSLTRNIGHDGSGLHCGVTDRFDVDLWDKEQNFSLPEEPFLDETWVESLASFRKIALRRKVKQKAASFLRAAKINGLLKAR